MTYDERQIEKRSWLKIDWYAVTKSLRSIFSQRNVPPDEQERFAFIQNEVLTSAEEGQDGRRVNISRRRWKSKCGGNYKRYIVQLEDWGQVNSIRSYKASHDADAFPMPCWVPKPALNGGLCSLEFRRKRLRPPVPKNHPTDDASAIGRLPTGGYTDESGAEAAAAVQTLARMQEPAQLGHIRRAERIPPPIRWAPEWPQRDHCHQLLQGHFPWRRRSRQSQTGSGCLSTHVAILPQVLKNACCRAT